MEPAPTAESPPPLKLDREAMKARGWRAWLDKIAVFATLLWLALVIHLFRRSFIERDSIAILNNDWDRLLPAGVVLLPLFVSIGVLISPLRYKPREDESLLCRQWYILNPNSWWTFFPLWPSAAMLAILIFDGTWSALDIQRPVLLPTARWSLATTLVLALMCLMHVGVLITANTEFRATPDGIRMGLSLFCPWDKINRAVQTPSSLELYTPDVPDRPFSELPLRTIDAVRPQLAAQGVRIETGLRNTERGAKMISVLMTIVVSGAAFVLIHFRVELLWIVVVTSILASGAIILMERLRGEHKLKRVRKAFSGLMVQESESPA